VYDASTRRLALSALGGGEALSSVSKRLGISRSTLRSWRDQPVPDHDPTACPRCSGLPLPQPEYAQLLGLYLGDGCLSEHKKAVYALRIACDDGYSDVIAETAAIVRAVYPGRSVHRVRAPGCTHLVSYWKHWPCLFPQHGPGRKHLRSIVLEEWQ
jgi:hypothetical protein